MMRLHTDGIEPPIEDGGVRAWAGAPSATPEAVGRAIEDLGRSGYRPLRPIPLTPDPTSMKHAWDGGADRDAGESPPVKAEES